MSTLLVEKNPFCDEKEKNLFVSDCFNASCDIAVVRVNLVALVFRDHQTSLERYADYQWGVPTSWTSKITQGERNRGRNLWEKGELSSPYKFLWFFGSWERTSSVSKITPREGSRGRNLWGKGELSFLLYINMIEEGNLKKNVLTLLNDSEAPKNAGKHVMSNITSNQRSFVRHNIILLRQNVNCKS